jgi:hypothetical protein
MFSGMCRKGHPIGGEKILGVRDGKTPIFTIFIPAKLISYMAGIEFRNKRGGVALGHGSLKRRCLENTGLSKPRRIANSTSSRRCMGRSRPCRPCQARTLRHPLPCPRRC